MACRRYTTNIAPSHTAYDPNDYFLVSAQFGNAPSIKIAFKRKNNLLPIGENVPSEDAVAGHGGRGEAGVGNRMVYRSVALTGCEVALREGMHTRTCAPAGTRKRKFDNRKRPCPSPALALM